MKNTSIESYHDPRTQLQLSSETVRLQKVFEAFPNEEMTAHEVAKKSTLNYFIIQKRLSLLARRNVIKETGITTVNGRGRTKYKLVK